MKFPLLLLSLLLAPLLPTSAEQVPIDITPIELTGTTGKFDFIKIDPDRHRLLACHTGNGTLDVIDLDSSKLIKSIPTGAAQGVAIDAKTGLYYVSASKPPQLVIIDATRLQPVGTIPLPTAADLVAYHAPSNRVFVCSDEKPELYIIDPVEKKILTTLTLPGSGMEDLCFDAKGTRLFQCMKDSFALVVIDLATPKVLVQWPTSPALKPHGLALISDKNLVLIAGGNGKTVLLDLATGQVIASTEIAEKVDQMAYDPSLKRAYFASGTGTISVVALSDDNKLTSLPALASVPGAHSIAVDPKTHALWIAYFKDRKAYVQSFIPQ